VAKFSSPRLKTLRRKKEKSYKEGNRTRVKHFDVLIKKEILHLDQIYTEALLGMNGCRQVWKTMKALCGIPMPRRDLKLDVNALNKTFAPPETDSHPFILPTLLPNTLTAEPKITLDSNNVYKELVSLNANKSAGPDGMHPKILKVCAQFLAEPLTKIFTRCISEGKIADCWRPVRITAVPKKEPGKFRPIACTPVLLKVLEKLVLPSFHQHLAPLDESQFAYRKKRSTTDALLHVVHSVLSSLDSKCRVFRFCFLDYTNAFNCVDRSKLLTLLETLGLPTSLIMFLQDYFKSRTQYMVIKGKSSEHIPIESGVLQGAILSPFLFSYYVNCIPQTDNVTLVKYADDVAVGCIAGPNLSSQKLQNNLNTILEWSKTVNLSINAQKCHDIIFSLARGERLTNFELNSQAMSIDNQEIPRTRSVKYLGVTLSHNLTWSEHVLQTFKKVRRLSFYILRLKSMRLPHRLLKRFVYSCVIVHILYCSPVIFPGLLSKDFALLRRAIRIVSNSSSIAYSEITSDIITRHFSSCEQLIDRTMSDESHPLHHSLSQCLSTSSTRNLFKLPYARTASYRMSTIPYLARFLVDKKSVIEKLTQELS
jgi:hypothetical protein